MTIKYEVLRIRRELKSDPDIYIKFEAFNKDEVDSIKSLLTDDEKKRITFSWLEFKLK